MSTEIDHQHSLVEAKTIMEVGLYRIYVISSVLVSKNTDGTYTPNILKYRLGSISHKTLPGVKWNRKKVIPELYRTGKLYGEYIESHVLNEFISIFTDVRE